MWAWEFPCRHLFLWCRCARKFYRRLLRLFPCVRRAVPIRARPMFIGIGTIAILRFRRLRAAITGRHIGRAARIRDIIAIGGECCRNSPLHAGRGCDRIPA